MSEELLKSIRNGIWTIVVINVVMIAFASWWNYHLSMRVLAEQMESLPGSHCIAIFQPLYDSGEFDRLIEQAEEELEQNPFNATAHYYLGIGYFQKGNLDQAKNCFDHAIKANPAMQESISPWLDAIENAGAK